MGIDYFTIENKALEILDTYGFTEPVINVAKIAKENKIEIEEVKMPEKYSGVAGFYNEKENIIYINTDDVPARKQFTIAHELGHIFLGHRNYGVLFRITHENAMYSKDEKEANSFAANLLMPEFMIIEYLKKYDFTKVDYMKMSKIFGVPIAAMKWRLERLV